MSLSASRQPCSISEAMELVQEISRGYGHLREDLLNTMSAEARQEIIDAFAAIAKISGSSVIT